MEEINKIDSCNCQTEPTLTPTDGRSHVAISKTRNSPILSVQIICHCPTCGRNWPRPANGQSGEFRLYQCEKCDTEYLVPFDKSINDFVCSCTLQNQ